MDELTDEQMQILAGAYVAAPDGGVVVADTAYPDAHALAEIGLLERVFCKCGELVWRATPALEHVWDMVGLMMTTTEPGREN